MVPETEGVRTASMEGDVIYMNHDLSGSPSLGTFAAGMTNVLQGWLESLGGPGIANPVFGTVTWGDLLIAGFFIVLTLVITGLVGARRPRRRRQKPTSFASTRCA